MSHDESHWDSDRAFERDQLREPTRDHQHRRRPKLTSYGAVRAAHEDAEVARVTSVDQVKGSSAVVQYLKPRPGQTRISLRACCDVCGFVGREIGPASAGDAYDAARAHRCGGAR